MIWWFCSVSIPVTGSIAHLHFVKMLPVFQLFYSDFSRCNNTVYGFTINYADWYALCQLSRIYGAFRTRWDWQPSILSALNASLQCRWPVSESTKCRQDAVPSSSTGRQNRWACSFQHWSEHQYNETYGFCCFYLLEDWISVWQGRTLLLFVARNETECFTDSDHVNLFSEMFFFLRIWWQPHVCLHLLAVLVQVNGDSAVAKKNKKTSDPSFV